MAVYLHGHGGEIVFPTSIVYTMLDRGKREHESSLLKGLLKGLGCTIVLEPGSIQNPTSRKWTTQILERSDDEAIAGDWGIVGGDLTIAISKFESEQRVRDEQRACASG